VNWDFRDEWLNPRKTPNLWERKWKIPVEPGSEDDLQLEASVD